MQLEGITIILTSKNVPSDIIGNVIFCSDILLSHYVDKLYEHRAFEVVEICTENDSFNSLFDKNCWSIQHKCACVSVVMLLRGQIYAFFVK
mgnify:CR=1 FL=1